MSPGATTAWTHAGPGCVPTHRPGHPPRIWRAVRLSAFRHPKAAHCPTAPVRFPPSGAPDSPLPGHGLKGVFAAGIRAERGVRGKRSGGKGCSWQAFGRKGAFLRPRLHEICVLRHSSCKRGKHAGRKGVLRPRLHEIGVLRHFSCKRGKHAGRKGVLRPRLHDICVLQRSSCKRGKQSRADSMSNRGRAYGEGGAYDKGRTTRQAVAPEHTARRTPRQTFLRKGSFSRSRLHEIGLLRHSSCKRGKHSYGKGHSPGRDCMKSAF